VVGASISPDAMVRSLTMPEQQFGGNRGGARKRGRGILILDEPTASLSDREVENLFRVIRELRGEGGGG